MPNCLMGGDSTINHPDYTPATWSGGYQKGVYGIYSDPLPKNVTNSGADLQGVGDGIPTSILAALVNPDPTMVAAATTPLDEAIAVTPNQ